MAVDVVLDADDGWEPEELPSIQVRMDGKLYTANCPKDGLPLLLARIEQRLDTDRGAAEELVLRALESIFDTEDAHEILARVMDMTDRKMSIGYVMHVVSLVKEHYEPQLKEHYAEMGVAVEKGPQDRRPARSTATKKKAAPARRR